MASRTHVLASPRRGGNGDKGRRGAILVLTALFMVFLIGLLAFSVDLGYMMTVRAELKRATDAAALAGAGALIDGPQAAELRAFEFLARNPVASRNILAESDWKDRLAELRAENSDTFEVQFGEWNADSRTFSASALAPSAIRVVAKHNNAPFFFGRVFGHDSFNLEAESIAKYQPRDIVLVLDYSASMNDDSELRRITEFGEGTRSMVEANLLQIYQELGSPHYGSLQFTPEYYTQTGTAPTKACQPQIVVTFRGNDVYVTSTKDLSNVVLQFSDGTKQKFDGLSGQTGTFKGSGGNANKRIDRCWVKSGCNDSGEGPGYGERFEDTPANIKAYFGLTNVPYPYPSGSWDAYISYVKSSSYVNRAGYRKKYGFLTLINYWLEQKPRYQETPGLWMVSEQPVQQIKDATRMFFDYIQEVPTNDRISLVVYNSPNQTALVEHHLTDNFSDVLGTVRQRQAGHYDNYTNIGAGLQNGIDELLANGRQGAFKMIVLMTDGVANRPGNTSQARTFALQQAQRAAENRLPVFTIGVGMEADADLLVQMAEMTKGKYFIVSGGEYIVNYEPELVQKFREIADHRPLMLVK
ncbi:MAG: VWA domain-containing protein [Thermogutta sp.]|nr:VWA domain-containing protein [Thermogutta sp.]